MFSSDMQTVVTLVIFIGIIAVIAVDLMDIALAGLLGVSLLVISGIFTEHDLQNVFNACKGPVGLLFGGMVVARTLKPTGVFELVGQKFLALTQGSGKRFLIGLIALTAPICAFLPNATTVILVAPIIVTTATALEVDFVGPLVLTALVSNSAGLLTLVGDPATFLVGSSIGMTFVQYLMKMSLGGLLSVLVIIPILPWIMPEIWNVRRSLPEMPQPKALEHRAQLVFSLMVLGCIVFLFIFGEMLPIHLIPPAVAIIGATLALLVEYALNIESVEQVLKDVDWKTLIFFTCMFCLVEAVTKTGLLNSLSRNFYTWFGTSLTTISFVLLAGVGILSGVLANTPVVAACLVLIKGYFVVAEMVPEEALGATFTAWPAATTPVFMAMMFGATLGGNATLLGASANIVSAGICATHGQRLTFMRFLRYGVPITVVQLSLGALYIWCLFLFNRL
jgi:Na+/H+ antiporter NhaD/arsenite permease-like protein